MPKPLAYFSTFSTYGTHLHGSTKYLWDRKSLLAAMSYVIHEQGEPMEYWYNEKI